VCGHEARVQAHVVGGVVPHQQQHLHAITHVQCDTHKRNSIR
jgi:hypothetical protein